MAEIRVIRMSSPRMNNVTLIGCGLMYMSVFFADLGEDITPQPTFCKLHSILASFGFSIALGALFSKTFRVHRIFINKKLERRVVRDAQLLLFVVVLVLVDGVIYMIWEIVDARQSYTRIVTERVIDEDTIEEVFVRKCESNYSAYFMACIFGIKGLLLVFGAFLAWETRKVNVPELNDSKNIGLCIYNVIIVSFVGVGMSFAVENSPRTIYIVESVCMIYGTSFTTAMIFVPKVMALYSGKVSAEDVNETSVNTIHGAVGESSTG